MNERHKELLPGTVTSIVRQQNNKNRYSIFIDEDFLMGVSDKTLLKRKLKKGMEVTPALFKALQRDEGYAEVKNYMLKLISRRRHARQELWRKARQKDYASYIIEDVLYELETKDFIDDKQFAVKFAGDKSSLKKWGPHKIKAHLRKKGIKNALAESAVRKAFEPINMRERLNELIDKRSKHFMREQDELKRKQKAVNYLLQKGYDSGAIFKSIDDILHALNEKDD